jgi:iron complex outermembrane receptor protein
MSAPVFKIHVLKLSVVTMLLGGLLADAAAQSIVGTVVGEDRMPVPGVQVHIPALRVGTVTDEQGQYTLSQVPLREVEVEFHFVGFERRSMTISVGEGENRLDVVLTETTIRMDEAVISAEGQAETLLRRSTQSIQVIEARELEAVRGQTLGQTLAQLPGVTELTTGPSISKPVIRGLHSQRVLVLNNGVAQEGQQWGGEHAPEIDPFAPGKIELIRGAAGVEYGIGAIGGVIRIEPEELPRNAPLTGRLMLNGFSNNWQGSGSLMLQGGPKSLPGLGWRVQGSLRKAGSSRTPDYWLGNTGFQELNGSATVGYDTDNVGLHAHYSHFGTELGLYNGAHIGNFDDLLRAIERGHPSVEYDFTYQVEPPKQRIRHDLIKVGGHFRLPGRDWIDAQYGFQLNHREEFDAHRRFGDPNEDPAFSLDLMTHTFDLKFRQRPRGDWIGVSGVSFINQNNENGETGFLIPNFHSVTGGVFTHQSLVRDRWTFEAGLRFDHRWMEAFPRERLSQGGFVRRTHTYSSLTGALGVIRQLTDHWSIAANIGTAWRPPGVNELYNFGVHHGTATFEVGDPDLGSERSYNVDLTIRHYSPVSQIEVSVYNNIMDGYIYLFPEEEPRVTIRGTFPSFKYTQTDAVLRGIDGSAVFRVMSRWELGVSASAVRGDDRLEDGPLIFMPADRVRFNVGFDLGDTDPFRFGAVDLHTTMVAEQTRVPEGVDFKEPPPGYVIFGLGYTTDIEVGSTTLRFGLSIENLLDTTYRDYLSRYRYFADDPGRTVILRLSMPLG